MPSMEEDGYKKQLLVPPTTLPFHLQKILVALFDVALPLEKQGWFTFASTILFIKKKIPCSKDMELMRLYPTAEKQPEVSLEMN